MDKEMMADWLQDIARYIEEESSLIRDISMDDALSDEGVARKVMTITFNVAGRAPQSEGDVSNRPRH